MQLHAAMRKKQEEIIEKAYAVTDIIELSESEYASLYQNLLRDREYFAERQNSLTAIDGENGCILVLGKGQRNGILVDLQGGTYARHSAFIPDARLIVKDHIKQLADYIVSEGTQHSEDGRWSNTYDELYHHFGANITDTNGNGKLLLEELRQREETSEVIMTEDCIEVSYHLQYCQNCGDEPWDVLSLVGCNIQGEHLEEAPPQSFALSEFTERMTGTVNRFIAEAVKNQVEGEYKIAMSAVHDSTDNNPFSDDLFMEMLSERREIDEVDYDYENDELSVALAPEYIRATDESGLRELTEQDIEIMCAKHILWLNEAGGEQADFSGCLIRGMDLSQKKLNEAIFDGTKIVNTNLYKAELCFASCVGTKFYNCYAPDITAEEASFKDAEFICTKMPRGMFTHSNFTEARIQNCEFYSSSMEYCCLEGTSFDETDTDHIRMNRCSYDESEWIAERDGITQTM